MCFGEEGVHRELWELEQNIQGLFLSFISVMRQKFLIDRVKSNGLDCGCVPGHRGVL